MFKMTMGKFCLIAKVENVRITLLFLYSTQVMLHFRQPIHFWKQTASRTNLKITFSVALGWIWWMCQLCCSFLLTVKEKKVYKYPWIWDNSVRPIKMCLSVLILLYVCAEQLFLRKTPLNLQITRGGSPPPGTLLWRWAVSTPDCLSVF